MERDFFVSVSGSRLIKIVVAQRAFRDCYVLDD